MPRRLRRRPLLVASPNRATSAAWRGARSEHGPPTIPCRAPEREQGLPSAQRCSSAHSPSKSADGCGRRPHRGYHIRYVPGGICFNGEARHDDGWIVKRSR